LNREPFFGSGLSGLGLYFAIDTQSTFIYTPWHEKKVLTMSQQKQALIVKERP
jgi:hypothetical protein